jgi:uncharacterized protein (UPF0335 family)
MTDEELIARLRSGLIGVDVDRRAADRIEALTAENAKLHDHIEGVAKNTHKIMVGYEAKLAKAVEALEKAATDMDDYVGRGYGDCFRDTLAEIKAT